MLLSLIPSLLGLIFRPLGLTVQLLDFFSLLPNGHYLLFRRSQMFLGITQEQPLILGLLLSALQSRVSTSSRLFLLFQFVP